MPNILNQNEPGKAVRIGPPHSIRPLRGRGCLARRFRHYITRRRPPCLRAQPRPAGAAAACPSRVPPERCTAPRGPRRIWRPTGAPSSRRTHHAIRFRSGPSRLPAGSGERVGVGMEAEPRHALGAGGRQPLAAQSAVQSPDPPTLFLPPPPPPPPPRLRGGASEVSASLRRSRLKQESAALLAGLLAPSAGVRPGLGGFGPAGAAGVLVRDAGRAEGPVAKMYILHSLNGLRRGSSAPWPGAGRATPKAARKAAPAEPETSRFRAWANPRRTRALGGQTRPVSAP